MARAQRVGKVARARIVPPAQRSLLESPSDTVRRVLVPGAVTERYQRTWRVGGTTVEDEKLYGRLGFESVTGADLWNPETKDFQDTPVPAGVAAPFAIRLRDLTVVFQTRGQEIKITSFVGALRSLLRDATGDDWKVETAHSRSSFDVWRRSVARVVQLRLHLEPPNPNYEGRPDVERLLAGLRLEAANLDLHGADVVTDADLVRQMLQHVDRGYGTAVAVGEREVDGRTVESVYSSALEGESEVAEHDADPETGEVSRTVLRQELETSGGPGEGDHDASRGEDAAPAEQGT